MSRTYRLRKDKREADSIRNYWDDVPKFQNNIPDMKQGYFWCFNRSSVKWHTNFWRRADSRRYEHEAMLYGETEFIENEKQYKMLHWCYD